MNNQEQMAFNLLKNISESLRNISDTLEDMLTLQKRETEQYLRESRQRMNTDRNPIETRVRKNQKNEQPNTEFCK